MGFISVTTHDNRRALIAVAQLLSVEETDSPYARTRLFFVGGHKLDVRESLDDITAKVGLA